MDEHQTPRQGCTAGLQPGQDSPGALWGPGGADHGFWVTAHLVRAPTGSVSVLSKLISTWQGVAGPCGEWPPACGISRFPDTALELRDCQGRHRQSRRVKEAAQSPDLILLLPYTLSACAHSSRGGAAPHSGPLRHRLTV